MTLNAIFTAATGMAANSEYLDVVGNNLANSNTTAFKSQEPLFKDLVYQSLSSGSGPSGEVGAVNPAQSGFGVAVAAVGGNFQQGSLTQTGRSLDLAVQGGGFFVLADGNRTRFTRAGHFDVDPTGYLVDPTTGLRVRRYGSVGEGFPGFQVAGNAGLRIPFGAAVPGAPTANVTVQGNLSAGLAVGDAAPTAIQIYDTQGTARALNVIFSKTAANTFSVTATVSGGTVTVPPTPVTFDGNGLLVSPATLTLTLNGLPGPQTVTVKLGTPGQTDGLTQFGGATSAAAVDQDGASTGTLTSVAVDRDGTVQGLFSNGRTAAIAQLELARFNNDSGLVREGDNTFAASAASGQALVGAAGTGARGIVVGGTLEQSNVDIAQEFTRLVLAQRGFQVNTRVVTVGNEVLQDLTSIIR